MRILPGNPPQLGSCGLQDTLACLAEQRGPSTSGEGPVMKDGPVNTAKGKKRPGGDDGNEYTGTPGSRSGSRTGEPARVGWGRRHAMGSGLHPKDNGKARNVLSQRGHIALRYTQMCPVKAVPILLLTFLVLNLDCKNIYHFRGTQ